MSESAPSAVEHCDVCIVGAGIAGLNALFVASRYLSRDQKVILVPRRLMGVARFMLTHRRERDRLRRTLDNVRERFDVRCGPLAQ